MKDRDRVVIIVVGGAGVGGVLGFVIGNFFGYPVHGALLGAILVGGWGAMRAAVR